MSKKVLLSWQLLPEEVHHYVITMNDEEYSRFSKCNDSFVNSEIPLDVEQSILVLGAAICDTPEYKEYCESEEETNAFGKWADCKLVEGNSDLSGVDVLLVTGQYL